MDKVTREVVKSHSDSKLISPLSPKRLKTDCAVTKDLCGNRLFNSSEAWTSQKSCLSLADGLIFLTECGHYQRKNPHDKRQENSLNITRVENSHDNGAHSQSNEECFISAERDEKHLVTETQTLSSYLRADTDESPAPSCSNAASLPNWKLENDDIFGSCRLFTGHDEDNSQRNINQLQAATACSNQSDCTSEDAGHDTGVCTEALETNQERDEVDFSDCVPLTKTEGALADPNPHYSNPDENLSVRSAEDGKNEKQKSELWISETENVSVCNVTTKRHVNENNMSETHMCSAAECAERSIVSNIVLSDTNIDIKNPRCEVNRDAEADHSVESLVASKISQEPVEGDNDADLFSATDPTKCSENDKEVQGMKLSSSLKPSNIETDPGLCCNVTLLQASSSGQTEEFNPQSRTQQRTNENNIRSHSGPQARSATNGEMQDNSNGDCPSSPRSRHEKPPPAEVSGIQNHESVGQLKEPSASSISAVRVDCIKTQQVEYFQSENDDVDKTVGVKMQKEVRWFLKENASNKQEYVEKTSKSVTKLQLHNEPDKKYTSAGVWISEWTREETRKPDGKLQSTECGEGNRLESFCPNISGKDETTERRKQRDVINVGEEIQTNGCENPQTRGKSEDNKKNQGSLTSKETRDRTEREESHGEGFSDWLEKSRWTFCNADDSELLSCFFHYQHRSEMPFTFSMASDAVGLCQPNLSHVEKSLHSPTARTRPSMFSTPAFTLYNHVVGGFDTFEKIKLSPHDDDEDAGLGNTFVHTSLPEEISKTPQQQHPCHMPKAELDILKKMPVKKNEGGEEVGEEEMERLECYSENMANGFVRSDSSCKDVPNLISAADVIALTWPEQEPSCGSAYDSSEHPGNGSKLQSESSAIPSECDSPPSDLSSLKFEMKEQFDRVLKELCLFFDISTNDFANDYRPFSPERCDVPEPPESNISKSKERLSTPDRGHQRATAPDAAAVDHSLEVCEVVSLLAVSSDVEQEVFFNRNLYQEAPIDKAEKHREPQEEGGPKAKVWSPSFMFLPVLEQLSHRPPEQPRRLAPLKTCTRPIRIGLSKRAKTKHLHRSHPYK